MSLSLPLPGHPARELIDVPALAQMCGDGSPKNFAKFPTLPEATRLAREFLAKETAARAAHYIVLRADGTLKLMRFGPRGGRSVVWNFGSPFTTGRA